MKKPVLVRLTKNGPSNGGKWPKVEVPNGMMLCYMPFHPSGSGFYFTDIHRNALVWDERFLNPSATGNLNGWPIDWL